MSRNLVEVKGTSASLLKRHLGYWKLRAGKLTE